VAPQALAIASSSKSAPVFKTGDLLFPDDVASGDPRPDAVTLWTRLSGNLPSKGSVNVEVAKDEAFNDIVAKQTVATSKLRDWTVKCRVKGLEPDTHYYYRFYTGKKSSRVGRTRTAPDPTSNDTVNLAYFSCALYTHGYWGAYGKMAAMDDLNAVICLGDFIYAETYFQSQGGPGFVRKDTVGVPKSLRQFRDKYHLYRSDQDLRDMLSRHPMISTWDDHEVIDNYYYRDPKLKREVRNGSQAFLENLPTYSAGKNSKYRRFGSFRFGKNTMAIVADERQYRDPPPCEGNNAKICPEMNNQAAFFGDQQIRYIQQRLFEAQHTDTQWKLLMSPLVISETRTGVKDGEGNAYTQYDGAQGFRKARAELLDFVAEKNIDNFVVCSGDVHTAIGSEVPRNPARNDYTADDLIGFEFTAPSISSIRLPELSLTDEDVVSMPESKVEVPRPLVNLLQNLNIHVKGGDFVSHGFNTITTTENSCTVTTERMTTTRKRTQSTKTPQVWSLEAGQRGLPDGTVYTSTKDS